MTRDAEVFQRSLERRAAAPASSERVDTPSFAKMRLRWRSSPVKSRPQRGHVWDFVTPSEWHETDRESGRREEWWMKLLTNSSRCGGISATGCGASLGQYAVTPTLPTTSWPRRLLGLGGDDAAAWSLTQIAELLD